MRLSLIIILNISVWCIGEDEIVSAPMKKTDQEALYSSIQGFVGKWWNGSDLHPDPCGWTPIPENEIAKAIELIARGFPFVSIAGVSGAQNTQTAHKFKKCIAIRPGRTMVVEEDDVSLMALKYFQEKEKLQEYGLYFSKLPKGVPIPPSAPSKRHNSLPQN
ncbi:hypothetical protein BUALT_Bualt17G0091600 [Buddleja alternifolia]|uniref:Uncharacterized protein n=1 Tax=Buddleja alternifolia TaxID=168488 RepID=A0AAV6W543_9LAMI|nr:hypothetical protein BUALT_Bualt17G0091600 [Buddleja alternifolia]